VRVVVVLRGWPWRFMAAALLAERRSGVNAKVSG
jgi:hypothetical protein